MTEFGRAGGLRGGGSRVPGVGKHTADKVAVAARRVLFWPGNRRFPSHEKNSGALIGGGGRFDCLLSTHLVPYGNAPQLRDRGTIKAVRDV